MNRSVATVLGILGLSAPSLNAQTLTTAYKFVKTFHDHQKDAAALMKRPGPEAEYIIATDLAHTATTLRAHASSIRTISEMYGKLDEQSARATREIIQRHLSDIYDAANREIESCNLAITYGKSNTLTDEAQTLRKDIRAFAEWVLTLSSNIERQSADDFLNAPAPRPKM